MIFIERIFFSHEPSYPSISITSITMSINKSTVSNNFKPFEFILFGRSNACSNSFSDHQFATSPCLSTKQTNAFKCFKVQSKYCIDFHCLVSTSKLSRRRISNDLDFLLLCSHLHVQTTTDWEASFLCQFLTLWILWLKVTQIISFWNAALDACASLCLISLTNTVMKLLEFTRWYSMCPFWKHWCLLHQESLSRQRKTMFASFRQKTTQHVMRPWRILSAPLSKEYLMLHDIVVRWSTACHCFQGLKNTECYRNSSSGLLLDMTHRTKICCEQYLKWQSMQLQLCTNSHLNQRMKPWCKCGCSPSRSTDSSFYYLMSITTRKRLLTFRHQHPNSKRTLSQWWFSSHQNNTTHHFTESWNPLRPRYTMLLNHSTSSTHHNWTGKISCTHWNSFISVILCSLSENRKTTRD